MIALNKLLDNMNIFQDMYIKIGENINLDYFCDAENKRKIIQLEYENLKSKCNKLCNELAKLKDKNQDFSSIYLEILSIEKKIKTMQNELEKSNIEINKNLKSLPNLPDIYLKNNVIISNNKTKYNNLCLSFNDFFDFLLKIELPNNYIFSLTETKLCSKSYICKIKNQIFNEENAFQIIKCSANEIILFVPDFQINIILNKIYNYLKNNSLKLIQLKTNNINKSSSDEYFSKLNLNESLKIEIKREYLTRLYNLKYKNKSFDMTKFLNQINIKIKFNK